MEATETLQETANRKAQALQEAEADWTRESASLHARRDQLETRKQELLAQRTQRIHQLLHIRSYLDGPISIGCGLSMRLSRSSKAATSVA